MQYEFKSKVTLWEANPKFFLATVPTKFFEEIKEVSDATRRGWGAVRVNVWIGKTGWQTSIFPTNSTKTFDLPLKAAVRKAEGIVEGSEVFVQLELVDF
jgi:hypothetical protein